MVSGGQPHRLLADRRAANLIYRNLTPAALYEGALRRDEALLASGGPMVCRTAPHTGRTPSDKFIVKESILVDNFATFAPPVGADVVAAGPQA